MCVYGERILESFVFIIMKSGMVNAISDFCFKCAVSEIPCKPTEDV